MLNLPIQHKLGILQEFIITNKYLHFKQFNDEYIVQYRKFQLWLRTRLICDAKCVTINPR